MTSFLERIGTARDQPLTVLTDGADEFRKTLECGRPIHRFHIGMKLKALENVIRPKHELIS